MKRYRRTEIRYTVVRETPVAEWPMLLGPERVADLALELTGQHDDDKERFWVILLDAQNRYMSHHLVSTGTISASLVHPREVLGPALREGASHLILTHNHPSGDPTPSKEDLHITRQIKDGAKLLGLMLHDHLVVGNGTGKWLSLAERGLL